MAVPKRKKSGFRKSNKYNTKLNLINLESCFHCNTLKKRHLMCKVCLKPSK